MTIPSRNRDGGNEIATGNVSQKPLTDPPEGKGPGGLGIRHLQTLLISFGFTIAYMLRSNMSVAIVAMSNSTTSNPDMEDFGWDSPTQSIILSSFFWGYIATQLPGGRIAHLWSAAKFWSICMFTCGVFNMLIPIAASTGGWMAVCACRFIMGLCQGCTLPCVHTLLGKWVPPNERGRLGTLSFAGSSFGTVIGLPISGWLAASSIGWPSVFYLFSVIAILWSIAFFTWGADSPAQHRSVRPAERQYIEESLGQVDIKKHLPTPWKQIFTSAPVWSLIIVHFTQSWGTSMLLTKIATYLDAILLFDISENGLISALPYLAAWLLSFPASVLSDYALERGWVTRGVARKVSNSIGNWGPAIALLGLGYATAEHSTLAVIALTCTVGLKFGTVCGYQINHIDLSPNFAGTLISITNCIASVMSILAPLVAGLIIVDPSDVTQWRTVFFISSGIYFVGNLIFVIFGKAEIQPWNEPEPNKNAENGKSRKTKDQEKSEPNKTMNVYTFPKPV